MHRATISKLLANEKKTDLRQCLKTLEQQHPPLMVSTPTVEPLALEEGAALEVFARRM